jgi:hypothetical protein
MLLDGINDARTMQGVVGSVFPSVDQEKPNLNEYRRPDAYLDRLGPAGAPT